MTLLNVEWRFPKVFYKQIYWLDWPLPTLLWYLTSVLCAWYITAEKNKNFSYGPLGSKAG